MNGVFLKSSIKAVADIEISLNLDCRPKANKPPRGIPNNMAPVTITRVSLKPSKINGHQSKIILKSRSTARNYEPQSGVPKELNSD